MYTKTNNWEFLLSSIQLKWAQHSTQMGVLKLHREGKAVMAWLFFYHFAGTLTDLFIHRIVFNLNALQ